ncbi:LIC_10091 family protein, partial [Leptospira kirschneri]|uniref:LIC_10091 family protein n=1 Tax=Leptospira kirschneri TaxID=29507 RepID=UPI003F89E825
MEDYFSYSGSFRENVLSLHRDQKGVYLSTMHNGKKEQNGYLDGEKIPGGYRQHYNVQSLKNIQ